MEKRRDKEAKRAQRKLEKRSPEDGGLIEGADDSMEDSELAVGSEDAAENTAADASASPEADDQSAGGEPRTLTP
jgi:hypothetical protein